MENKLYKSSTDKKLAGVCGGLADNFGIDSTIVRLLWFIFSFFYGIGIILYIACALIMQYPPEEFDNNNVYQREVKNKQLDSIEEIRRYKDLLDEGIISEEEFNKKKNDLLGM